MANEKRLIDANDMKRDIMEAMMHHFMKNGDQIALRIGETLCHFVDVTPTVDAVEVVHGRWIDGYAMQDGKEVYKSIDCSHCNEIFKTDDREYWKARFKVCPFCGAKMDSNDER